MTRERAQYIIDNQFPFGGLRYAFRMRCDENRTTVYPDGITVAEDAHIGCVWDTMPGGACYFQALLRIAKGEDSAGLTPR